jgi:hypothetical protein
MEAFTMADRWLAMPGGKGQPAEIIDITEQVGFI